MKNEEKALEAEMLRRRFAEIENQLVSIEQKRLELEVIKGSIDDIKGHKDEEIMIPLGSGVLIKGKIVDDSKFLINVGANVILEKTASEAKKIIDEQIKELGTAEEMLQKELKNL